MSYPTEPGEAAPDDGARGRGPQIAIGVAGAVVVFLLLLVAVVLFGGDEGDLADPGPVASPTPTPTPTPSPSPSPTPTPTPTPQPQSTPTEREPTDTDAAEFAAAFAPPEAEGVEAVTVDVTGDGWREIVFVSRAVDVTRLDIAQWDGRAYDIVFTDRGGEADEVVDFFVTDLNGDGTRDVMTRQAVGEDGESVSLWGYDGEQFARQVADGGCWDGGHTYGAIGATVDDGELEATCDDSPLPPTVWTTDVYEWDGDGYRWVHARTEEP